MGKLHQLLAVESDLKDRQKIVVDETINTFNKKQNLFFGSNRKYKPFDESDTTEYPEEDVEMTTTVEQRLDYTEGFVIPYIDALLQKEVTNQEAKASIEIDGKALTDPLPATFLLGLESRLKELRNVYKVIPTLTQGVKWQPAPDLGDDVFIQSHPEKKFKTRKTFQHKVLVEPTEHHPAQIEKWEEVENVGIYEKNVWSGLVTSARKAEMLDRIDKLLVAVKQARQKANNIDVKPVHIGKTLFDYITE